MSVCDFVYPTVQNSPRGCGGGGGGGVWVWTLLTHGWRNVTISAGVSITALKLAISEGSWPPEELLHNAFPNSWLKCNKRIWHTCKPICAWYGWLLNFSSETANNLDCNMNHVRYTRLRTHVKALPQHRLHNHIYECQKVINVVNSHWGLTASWQKTSVCF